MDTLRQLLRAISSYQTKPSRHRLKRIKMQLQINLHPHFGLIISKMAALRRRSNHLYLPSKPTISKRRQSLVELHRRRSSKCSLLCSNRKKQPTYRRRSTRVRALRIINKLSGPHASSPRTKLRLRSWSSNEALVTKAATHRLTINHSFVTSRSRETMPKSLETMHKAPLVILERSRAR